MSRCQTHLTPSWVLLAGLLLFLLADFLPLDLVGWRAWAFPLVVISMNSIAAYCMDCLPGFRSRRAQTPFRRGLFSIWHPLRPICARRMRRFRAMADSVLDVPAEDLSAHLTNCLMKPRLILVAATLITTLIGRASTPANLIDDSWETAAARDEIRPEFAFEPHGRAGSSSLEIFSDTRRTERLLVQDCAVWR
jgi:hypothetical protein